MEGERNTETESDRQVGKQVDRQTDRQSKRSACLVGGSDGGLIYFGGS